MICLCGHPYLSHESGECTESGCPCVKWEEVAEGPTPFVSQPVVSAPIVVTGQMVVTEWVRLPNGDVVPDPALYPWLYKSEVAP